MWFYISQHLKLHKYILSSTSALIFLLFKFWRKFLVDFTLFLGFF